MNEIVLQMLLALLFPEEEFYGVWFDSDNNEIWGYRSPFDVGVGTPEILGKVDEALYSLRRISQMYRIKLPSQQEPIGDEFKFIEMDFAELEKRLADELGHKNAE